MASRTIEGFRQDDHGEWVAELSCLHGQHVRHRPPFVDRPWVVTGEGRASRVGSQLDCPLCERAELPEGLQLARTAGPFDEQTVPAALRREHRVAERTWGYVRVLEGALRFSMRTVDPPIERAMRSGDTQPIPPGLLHSVEPVGAVQFEVDFLVARADC